MTESTSIQTRLYFRGGREEMQRILDLMDPLSDEEGWPLSIAEIDEDADIHEVSAYVGTDEEDRARELLFNLLGSDLFGLELQREALPDIDWVSRSLQELKPVRVGRVIVHGAHDRAAVRPSDIGIEIEAAQAFGTGHHGTTAGCLSQIQSILKTRKPRAMLDLGTGSAVLAIALARLAGHGGVVVATDIDPIAVAVARGNARLNECEGAIEFATAAGVSTAAIRQRAPFDLVVANILAGPLMALAPAMARIVAPGGDLVLSGILDRQAARVRATYVTVGFSACAEEHRAGWTTLRLTRR